VPNVAGKIMDEKVVEKEQIESAAAAASDAVEAEEEELFAATCSYAYMCVFFYESVCVWCMFVCAFV